MAQQTYKIFNFVLTSLNEVINNKIGSLKLLAKGMNTQKPRFYGAFLIFRPTPKPVNNFSQIQFSND